ncbi:Flp pilus assembly pilin Flp [Roseovarius sp. MBR-51]
MIKFFKNFSKDEDGAVTVDWVVLTAAVVGLGIAGVASVSDGIDALATKIETGVTNQVVADPGTGG